MSVKSKKTKKRLFPRVQKHFTDKSRTKQAMRKECDINHIMKVYKNHGVITHVSKKQAKYGDFSQSEDYLSSLNLILKAQDQFDELPSLIRERFDNDPAKLLAFVENPNNIDEAIYLGIVNEPEIIEDEVELPSSDEPKES